MVRILVFSDTHENTKVHKKIIEIGEKTCDFIICAGDIEVYKDVSVPFFFVSGNHDRDKFNDLLLAIDKGILELKNFINIQPGRVYTQNGIRIAGLPGNYSSVDFNMKRHELRHQRHFTKDEVDSCLKLRNIDIFVAHESAYGVADLDWKTKSKHFGVKPVRQILDTVQPRFMVCGHIHSQQVEKYNNTIVLTPGYGVNGEYTILNTTTRTIGLYHKLELRKVVLLDNISQGEIFCTC